MPDTALSAAVVSAPVDPVVLEGAQVILQDRVEALSVRIEDGRISALDGARDGARVVDVSGYILVPAMIDIHGDAFERQLMPRPGVFAPLHAALFDTDRQLAGNGIATAYHALTLSWEPGLRSVARGTEIVRGLADLAGRLAVENRVQLRWESFCPEAIDLIAEALGGPLLPSIAFNDHTSMAMLDKSVPLQTRPFEFASDFPVIDLAAADPAIFAERAKRAGLSPAAYRDLMQKIWDRRPDVPGYIAQVAAMGRAAQAPMLSHDDSQDETRRYFRTLGARISEFPMNLETAQAARDAGDFIVFGAPNAMRGGSHLGSPGAAQMIARGLCDILASDYFYPAMLGAVARLCADGVADLAAAWSLVSTNPAKALGLHDRGRIAEGLRADLVLLDWPEGAAPAPVLTLCAGRVAHASRFALAP